MNLRSRRRHHALMGLHTIAAIAPSCHRDSSSTGDGVCTVVDGAAPALIMTDSTQVGSISCATLAVPDVVTASGSYEVDTGAAFVGQPPQYFVGPMYGQSQCPDQFLAEIDLSPTNAAGQDVFMNGLWSVILPGAPCGYQSTMTVWGLDETGWTRFDQINFLGQPWTDANGKPFCQADVVKRAIPTSLGGTSIPPNRFTKARIAAVATDCDHKIPVSINVQALP
jgi:hypothetical protein